MPEPRNRVIRTESSTGYVGAVRDMKSLYKRINGVLPKGAEGKTDKACVVFYV